jgi:hypothetical protein
LETSDKSNLERFKSDISKLVTQGDSLLEVMVIECFPDRKAKLSAKTLASLPVFRDSYQTWYSEALVCLAQTLPTRVDDFTRYYHPDKSRKELTALSYTISDYLHGLGATRTQGIHETKIVGLEAAIPKFKQQIEIVRSMQQRFESTLFDIRAVVQADLYDSELEAATDLNRNGFFRAAGAIAGVVLEGHLHVVFANHSLTVPKKAMLGLLIEDLKKNNVLDIPSWRFLQHLADIRNLCDHKLDREPTKDDVTQLLEGVRKSIKTIF